MGLSISVSPERYNEAKQLSILQHLEALERREPDEFLLPSEICHYYILMEYWTELIQSTGVTVDKWANAEFCGEHVGELRAVFERAREEISERGEMIPWKQHRGIGPDDHELRAEYERTGLSPMLDVETPREEVIEEIDRILACCQLAKETGRCVRFMGD